MVYRNIDVEPSKMSTRGQVVIPQGIRERMGLEKDALFMVSAFNEDTIVMKRVDKAKIAAGFLKLRESVLKKAGGMRAGEIDAEINAVRRKV